ncbi:unnamed protein product [Closterium sp. NIES-64]|nr:unnamed protein product [Closterium sp. NIES-64]
MANHNGRANPPLDASDENNRAAVAAKLLVIVAWIKALPEACEAIYTNKAPAWFVVGSGAIKILIEAIPSYVWLHLAYPRRDLRRCCPSLPPPRLRPPRLRIPLPRAHRLLRRRLRISLRRLVAASPSPCRDPPSPPPPSRRRAFFGAARASLLRDASSSPAPPAAATSRRRLPLPPPRRLVIACPSRCRDVTSPPPLTAAAPSSAPPAHPAAATPRRRLPSRRRDFASPPARPAAVTRSSPPSHPTAATRSSPPARPAAATSRRRLRIPPPRPARRRLHIPPSRPNVAACTSCRRDLLSPPVYPTAATCSSPPAHPADAIYSSPPAHPTAATYSSSPAHPAAATCSSPPDTFVGPYCVLDVLLRRPHALQPTAPTHPGEPPPPPIPLGPPPPRPTLEIAATPELQAAADTTFLHNRREYLIRKAEHEVAVHHHEFATAERATRLALLNEYTTAMADYLPKSIAWATADNRACTILLSALPNTLMHRFQAREMHTSLIWAKLQAMFECRDISSIGALFQYFSITLATCDSTVDYVGRMQEVADRLAARQAALPEPLQIHHLLYNLTPDYESRLHTFTEANLMAGLDDVVHRATRVIAATAVEVVALVAVVVEVGAVVGGVVVAVAVVAGVAVVVVLAAPLLEDPPVLVVL